MAANRINNVCVTHLCHSYEKQRVANMNTSVTVYRHLRQTEQSGSWVQHRHTGSHCSSNATFPNRGPNLGSS